MKSPRLPGLIGPPDLEAWLVWVDPAIDREIAAGRVVETKPAPAQPSAPKQRKRKAAGSKGGAT